MGFLGSFFKFGRSEEDIEPADPFFAEVLTELGESITSAPNYEEELSKALQIGSDYLARQISLLPGPIHISESAFSADPVLSTMFHHAEDIRFALGRSIETREVIPGLAKEGATQAYALLGMRTRELENPDGTKVTVFMDHSIKCVTTSAEDARETLSRVALSRVLKSFAEHTDKLRRRGKLLRVEWSIISARARGNGAHDSGEFVFAEEELKPANLLRGLCAWLSDPMDHLRIKAEGARISVQIPGAAKPLVYDLPMLYSADRRQWLVSIVEFPVDECMAALSNETRTHRYIYI